MRQDSRTGDTRMRRDRTVSSAVDSRPGLLDHVGTDLLRPLTIVFVRHGVTEMTASRRFSGSDEPGPSLSATGRVQAAKAADAVYDIGRRAWANLPVVSRVLASPMTRTQETGGAIGRRLGVSVETEPLLREAAFGGWQGLTADQILDADGDVLHRWRFGEVAPPGGESMSDVGARLDGALRGFAVEHARLSADGADVERAWTAVSHAVAIKSAVAISLGIELRSWGAIWPEPASLTILQLRITAEGDIAERHLMCLGAPTY